MANETTNIALEFFDGSVVYTTIPTKIASEEGLLDYKGHIMNYSRYDVKNDVFFYQEMTLPYKMMG